MICVSYGKLFYLKIHITKAQYFQLKNVILRKNTQRKTYIVIKCVFLSSKLHKILIASISVRANVSLLHKFTASHE